MPRLRRPARMHALGPGAVLQELEAARGHGERDALRHHQALGTEPHQRAGSERAAEHADQSGRVEADLVERPAADGGQARCRFHAGDIGGEQVGAGGTLHVGGRQHRRPNAGGGMDDPAGVRVVEVEAVHQDAVEQRGVPRRQAQRQTDHGNIPRPAQSRDRGRRLVGEVVAAGGERNACRIEDQVLGPLAHLGRDGCRREVMGEARQRLGDQLRLRLRRRPCLSTVRSIRFMLASSGARRLRQQGDHASDWRIDQLQATHDEVELGVRAVHTMLNAHEILAQVCKVDAQTGDLAAPTSSSAGRNPSSARPTCPASRLFDESARERIL